MEKLPARATYTEIKQWIAANYNGMKVSSLYVAQVKQKHNIIERECYNKPKSENAEMMTALSAAKDKFAETTITEAKKKAQEEAAAAEFQKKEDALEAQREVLSDFEKLKENLQKIIDTDASRKRFMESHKFRDGRTLEDAYQQSILQQKERTEAILQKATELTAQYDAMKSQDVQAELN